MRDNISNMNTECHTSYFILSTFYGSMSDSIPIWQPDASALSCVLCSNKFSFFNRRHHCRKCGRVVCGECSDQQIRYFASTMIVCPNGKQMKPSTYEKYRTCDECVEEIRMIRRALFEEDPARHAPDGSPVTGLGDDVDGRDGGVVGRNVFAHDNSSTSSVTKYMNTRTRTRLVHSSTQSSATGTPRMIASSPHNRDDLSDHNLCPVCAINLLKIFNGASTDEFEAFKEAHICDCLTQFDFNLDHQRSPTAGDPSRLHTRNKMLVYNIPPIPKPQFETFTPAAAAAEDSTGASNSGFTVGSDTSNYSAQMSEKHVTRECVICLEDLKPGDKVGRLECLCVFHYKCIKDWFNKKGYGECPVHFLHK